MKNTLIGVVTVLLGAAFVVIARSRPRPLPVLSQTSLQQESGVPVRVAPVVEKTVADGLNVTGQLAAESVTNLSTKVAGKVMYVAAREGESVQAGQVVIRLDDSNARGQLLQAMAGVEEARAGLKTAQTRLTSARATSRVGDAQSVAAVAQAGASLRSNQAQLQEVQSGARRQEKAQAQGQVNIAKANLEKAESDYKRYQDLYAQNAIAAVTLDQYRTAVNVARSQHENAVQAASLTDEGARSEEIRRAESAVQQAVQQLRSAQASQETSVNRQQDVRSAQAGVSQAQAQLASAEAAVVIARQNVADYTIRAPRSGAVTARNLEPGQYAQPGGALLTIVDLSTIYLQADVSETDVARVRPGIPVTVRVDALTNRTWQGQVDSVIASADASSRTFTAKVRIVNTDRSLRPNMYGNAEVVTGRIANAILVPKAAIFQANGRKVVATVQNGTAKFVPVTTGVTSGDDVVVRAGALGPNARVIVSGQENLADGQKVSVT